MPPKGVEPADWERLSALADDELPPEEEEALRRRLGREPALAAAFGRIEGTKARLRGLWNDRGTAPARNLIPRNVGVAVAGALLGALAAALFLDSPSALRPGVPPSALDWHRWLAASGPASALVVAASPLDLRSAGLTLERDLLIEGSGGPLVLRHYRGSKGCRVTHVVGAAGTDGIAAPGEVLWHAWTTEGAPHALLSEGMDPVRFAAIAAFAQALTHDGVREEDAPVLAEAARRAAPCMA